MTPFIPGLQPSELLYHEAVWPILERSFFARLTSAGQRLPSLVGVAAATSWRE